MIVRFLTKRFIGDYEPNTGEWGGRGGDGRGGAPRPAAHGSLLPRQPLLPAGPSGRGPRRRGHPRHAGMHPGTEMFWINRFFSATQRLNC